MSSMEPVGHHVLIDLHGCPSAGLDDEGALEAVMRQAAAAMDATVVSATFHHFAPHGVTGVLVIEESHLAIHTWPEHGYAAVDVFTCGAADPWPAVAVLRQRLGATADSCTELHRGGHSE